MKLCQSELASDPFQPLLISFGGLLTAVSVFADSVGIGNPGFGLEQLSGVVIGLFLSISGVLKLHRGSSTSLARVLAFIYVSGILYVGLLPRSFHHARSKVLLSACNFGWHDFAVNIAGFVLLGYLLMLSFGIRKHGQETFSVMKKAMVVVAFGGSVSLFVEISQYYLISGRTSSLIDLVANTLGTLIGVGLYGVWAQQVRKEGEGGLSD
jgi:glycopeptide antibiotics resistance protein